MSAAETSSRCTVYIHPPAFPKTFEPFACDHPVTMQACDASIVWKPQGGGKITVLHARCLACGAPVGTGQPLNIFVDIARLQQIETFRTGAMSQRLIEMRDIYLRRAAVLFGPDGWLGDESWLELAKMIDPNLTMRLTPAGQHGDETTFWKLGIDGSYWSQLDATPEQGQLAL